MIGHSSSFQRPVRAAVVGVVTATALSLTACGSSDNSQPSTSASPGQTSASSTSAAPTTTPPPGPPQVTVQGVVASIAQSTVTVTTKTGPSRVNITPATKVSQLTAVDLRAVVVGSCVAISHGAAAPNTPPQPANLITVSAAPAGGKCKQFHDEKTSTGTVTAVNGPSVVVADTDGAPTTVPVGNKTKFQRRDNTSALAITPGSCLKASGTQVTDGVLQVVGATVSTPPAPGKCPGVK